MATWPGTELVSARSIERAAHRQRLALAGLAVGAAAAQLVLAEGSESLLAYIAIGALVGILLESLLAAYERGRADRSADALIEAGFRCDRRSDAVSAAVVERISELRSERRRRRMAAGLRANVELDRSPPTPVGMRCAAIPPIHGLARRAGRVERIAATLERRACDPRAMIAIERFLTEPLEPSPGAESDEVVEAELGRIERLIFGSG